MALDPDTWRVVRRWTASLAGLAVAGAAYGWRAAAPR